MSSTARQAAPVGAQTACDIGVEGYTFPYPITVMNLTGRPMSGVVAAGRVIGRGPADAFVNVPVSPAELRDAVSRTSARSARSPDLIFVTSRGSCPRRRRAAV